MRTPNEGGAKDAFASLVLAAREDPAFWERLTFVLSLPEKHRESLVKTAVEEMTLRGEPDSIRAAFLTLATPDAAERVLRILETR